MGMLSPSHRVRRECAPCPRFVCVLLFKRSVVLEKISLSLSNVVYFLELIIVIVIVINCTNDAAISGTVKKD